MLEAARPHSCQQSRGKHEGRRAFGPVGGAFVARRHWQAPSQRALIVDFTRRLGPVRADVLQAQKRLVIRYFAVRACLADVSSERQSTQPVGSAGLIRPQTQLLHGPISVLLQPRRRQAIPRPTKRTLTDFEESQTSREDHGPVRLHILVSEHQPLSDTEIWGMLARVWRGM